VRLGPRRLAALGCLVLLAAGCSTTTSTTQPSGSTTTGLDGTPSSGAPVELDPTVLAFLPSTVGGVAVTESADEATQALTDPSLGKIGSAVDAGVAVDGAGNLVYAWVVRLRENAFNDAIYQQWRDSYDEGACADAGGVVGRAEATIDARTVYITSCTASVRTYHVWLEQPGILISASAIGDGRFGEVLMDNLQVPG